MKLFLINRTPNYNFLKSFGCFCFPYLCPYNNHKLNFWSATCMFLGYSNNHLGYIIAIIHKLVDYILLSMLSLMRKHFLLLCLHHWLIVTWNVHLLVLILTRVCGGSGYTMLPQTITQSASPSSLSRESPLSSQHFVTLSPSRILSYLNLITSILQVLIWLKILDHYPINNFFLPLSCHPTNLLI